MFILLMKLKTVSAISGFHKTSTLRGNHTSGYGTPISFSILEYLCYLSCFIFIYTLPNVKFILLFTTVPVKETNSII